MTTTPTEVQATAHDVIRSKIHAIETQQDALKTYIEANEFIFKRIDALKNALFSDLLLPNLLATYKLTLYLDGSKAIVLDFFDETKEFKTFPNGADFSSQVIHFMNSRLRTKLYEVLDVKGITYNFIWDLCFLNFAANPDTKVLYHIRSTVVLDPSSTEPRWWERLLSPLRKKKMIVKGSFGVRLSSVDIGEMEKVQALYERSIELLGTLHEALHIIDEKESGERCKRMPICSNVDKVVEQIEELQPLMKETVRKLTSKELLR